MIQIYINFLAFHFNDKNGYHLLARNDSVVLCVGCGGVHDGKKIATMQTV
jgi:hypothetical protein